MIDIKINIQCDSPVGFLYDCQMSHILYWMKMKFDGVLIASQSFEFQFEYSENSLWQ